jgi:hypothetical protein
MVVLGKESLIAPLLCVCTVLLLTCREPFEVNYIGEFSRSGLRLALLFRSKAGRSAAPVR